jgi:hypothetical protein
MVPAHRHAFAIRALDLAQHGKLGAVAEASATAGHVLRIERPPMPNDPASREFDYSPERLRLLFAQGEEAAQRAWDETMAGTA